ncbi:hypothetical protein [Nitrosarchaeum sp. AC2]|uniref:hypothetical protein n=1 Tax=Nitrosarchaeum sp. AC2 TaxID=2259673 RepID=UPI0015C81886|nr:hypothetical protein [Nitrosarchaeum sp. AC2]QLH10864.1 hypothetical protein DSQ20_04785 [Nitrosarchaeum sp. AC2]
MNLDFFANHKKTTIVLLIFSVIGMWFIGMMVFSMIGSVDTCYRLRDNLQEIEGTVSICNLFFWFTG